MKKTLFFIVLFVSIVSAVSAQLAYCLPPSNEVCVNLPSGCTSNATLDAWVLLEHAGNSNTCLMNTDLVNITGQPNSAANFPLKDPYWYSPLNLVFKHYNSPFYVINGKKEPLQIIHGAINMSEVVDWVFIELRENLADCPAFTHPAILLNDGHIVDVNGRSVAFHCVAPGVEYHVTIRHRNHLSITSSARVFSANTQGALDFRIRPGVTGHIPLVDDNLPLVCNGTFQAMIGGNGDISGSSFETINTSDLDLWEAQNGYFSDYSLNADYNLDGSVDAFDTIIWELEKGKSSSYSLCSRDGDNINAEPRSTPEAEVPTTNSVKISPNPTGHSVQLQFDAAPSSEFQVAVYDIYGKVVTSKNIVPQAGQTVFEMGLSNLPSATYFISIQNELFQLQKRVVKL